MLTLMLTSKGVAAVPRASLVILSGALAQFGLPLQAVAVILGVDALMDMARTSLNVVGNCLATVVMARWEGEFDKAPVDAGDRCGCRRGAASSAGSNARSGSESSCEDAVTRLEPQTVIDDDVTFNAEG